MAKEEILRELYNMIKEMSVFTLKPFEKFYAENSNKSEEELNRLLRTVRKMKSLKK